MNYVQTKHVAIVVILMLVRCFEGFSPKQRVLAQIVGTSYSLMMFDLTLIPKEVLSSQYYVEYDLCGTCVHIEWTTVIF